NGKRSLVTQTKVFKTSEINSIYPKHLQTDRYEIYIYPSEAILGSQQDGIYGLLDELNAYYWGTKTDFDLYNFYQLKANNTEGWVDFYQGFYGTCFAYLEFKSYMLTYMLYAKQKYPEIYTQILANTNFLESFGMVDSNWMKLILQFNSLKQNFVNAQKIAGTEVYDSEEFMFIGGSGLGTFRDIYAKFNAELSAEKYETMAKAMGLKTAAGLELK
ncbi:MAG TPA: hypothetical protein DCQ31_03585, partial [Bacteroidales bacterium]|nr:hypothetical protein [Bacteroidales bacterium]